MSAYREMPREALEAEIDRLRAEVERLQRLTWWERFKGWFAPKDAAPGEPLPPIPGGHEEGDVWTSPTGPEGIRFVCFARRIYGKQPCGWVDVETGKTVSDRLGATLSRLSSEHEERQLERRRAHILKQRAGLL